MWSMLLIVYIPSLIFWLAQIEYQDYNNIHNLSVVYVFLRLQVKISTSTSSKTETRSSKVVQWTESILSKLTTFPYIQCMNQNSV